MAYNLLLTKEYGRQFDAAIDYILFNLQNKDAARRLMDEIDKCYLLLEENPFVFAVSQDQFLADRNYRQAFVLGYSITYLVNDEAKVVYLMAFQHQRQDPVKSLSV